MSTWVLLTINQNKRPDGVFTRHTTLNIPWEDHIRRFKRNFPTVSHTFILKVTEVSEF